MSNKLSIGLLGVGGTLSIKDGFLQYVSPYAKRFQVVLRDISTASTSPAGLGKSKLKIIGHGSTLAEVDLPTPWAEKAQRWIVQTINAVEPHS